MNADTRQHGFTLIEALVAFFVLALAVAAVLRLTSNSVELSGQLRARVLADWVAQDRMEERRAMADWPAPGIREGETRQAGQVLRWKEVVSASTVASFNRIEIVVHAEAAPDSPLARLVGFLPAPGS